MPISGSSQRFRWDWADQAIYHARFIRYLENRGLEAESTGGKVGAFLGDGEMDEPESLGSITLASRRS